MTLNALSTALEGRGEQLGATLDDLQVYLAKIDQSLPTLREDLIRLADVADTYDLAAPDLLAVLRNLTVTARTVVERRADLDVFFSDLGGLADDLDAGPVRQRGQPDRDRQGQRAAAQAPGRLLAGVPLPDQGRGPLRPDPVPDLRGQRDQAVHRVRHQPVPRATPPTTCPSTARSGTARGARDCPTRRSRQAGRPRRGRRALSGEPRARAGVAPGTSGRVAQHVQRLRRLAADQAIINALLAGADRPGRRTPTAPSARYLRPRRPRG